MMKVTDDSFGDITITAACSASLISDIYRDGNVKNIEYGDGEITVTARMRKEMMAKYMGHPIEMNPSSWTQNQFGGFNHEDKGRRS